MTGSGIPQHVEAILATHRRGFLKSAGLLLVSFASGTSDLIAEPQRRDAGPSSGQGSGPYPDPDPRKIDSWIVVHENNGKCQSLRSEPPGHPSPKYCGDAAPQGMSFAVWRRPA